MYIPHPIQYSLNYCTSGLKLIKEIQVSFKVFPKLIKKRFALGTGNMKMALQKQ
jgi:hypothetical protein